MAAEVVLFGFGGRARGGCETGSALLSLAALTAGLVTVVAVIPDELKPFSRDMSGQGCQCVQRGEPFRGGGWQVAPSCCRPRPIPAQAKRRSFWILWSGFTGLAHPRSRTTYSTLVWSL